MINERLLLLDSSSDSDSDLEDALLLEVLDRQDIQYRAQLYGNFNLENYLKCEKRFATKIRVVGLTFETQSSLAFVLCSTILTSFVDIFSYGFVLMLSFFVAMMCQLGMYCWFGNEIILNSLATRDACYESDWINCSVHVRKMLLLIMERSKRPVHLTAGKFSVLSLTSFTSVMNSAYSFFALMQRMYRKSEDI